MSRRPNETVLSTLKLSECSGRYI